MSYRCYLGTEEMPVTPSKLTVKIKNKNKTLVLLNEGEINFLRTPGLTELTVPLTFPMFHSIKPDYYLSLLETLKASRLTTRFKLLRSSPDGKKLFDTDMKVSVEDYNITENAKDGFDVSVDVNLKQWRDYGIKTVKQSAYQSTQNTLSITITQERETDSAPTAQTHTVAAGDTLWALAAKYYGSGAQYTKIYNANSDKISNPNLIYAGQVLTIP